MAMASSSDVKIAIAETEENNANKKDCKVELPEKGEQNASEFADASKTSKGIYSQGLINISLLSANATQLRSAQSNTTYQYRTTVISLIIVSIVLQVVILVLLTALTMAPRKGNNKDTICFVWRWLEKKRLKSMLLFLVSVLTAVNVFISAYHNE
nr:uncharacterized protein LOC117692978 [Crassostrea gigas]